MINVKKLDFQPLLGIYSKHLQILMAYFFPAGEAPSSKTVACRYWQWG